jgi:hypothetical protein
MMRYLRERTTRARAAMQPTLRVKAPQAAILAVSLGTVFGFAGFLLVSAAIHGSVAAAILGAGILYVVGTQILGLLEWWRVADRARQPIPISWEMQLLSVIVAGLVWAWLKFLVTTWIT